MRKYIRAISLFLVMAALTACSTFRSAINEIDSVFAKSPPATTATTPTSTLVAPEKTEEMKRVERLRESEELLYQASAAERKVFREDIFKKIAGDPRVVSTSVYNEPGSGPNPDVYSFEVGNGRYFCRFYVPRYGVGATWIFYPTPKSAAAKRLCASNEKLPDGHPVREQWIREWGVEMAGVKGHTPGDKSALAIEVVGPLIRAIHLRALEDAQKN